MSSASSGYSWWQFKKVLTRLGWRQTPNHTSGYLTFHNDLGDSIVIMKEDDMNLDYFHKLLKELRIPAVLFAELATESSDKTHS